MTANYSPMLPRDKGGEPMQNHPAPIVAKAQYSNGGNVSSVMTMTDNTTTLEIAAIGGVGAVMRWVSANDTQASVIATAAGKNFDHVIPANAVRRFVVPFDPNDTPAYASIVGVNVQLGLYNRYAIIATASPASSILASEY